MAAISILMARGLEVPYDCGVRNDIQGASKYGTGLAERLFYNKKVAQADGVLFVRE
jgi:hypothetical protein